MAIANIGVVPRRRPAWLARQGWVVILAFAIVALFLFVAVAAQWIAPYDFTAIDLVAGNAPPVGFGGTWAHPFGTDDLGRDVFSRTLISVRTSLTVALVSSLVSGLIGVTFGLISARNRGFWGGLVRIAVDFNAALPFMILALAVLAFFGNNIVLFVCLLGLYGWERYTRLVRAVAMAEYEKGYVAALRRNGASERRIAIAHVLRNVMPVIVVNWTVSLPEVILLESSLSFLGLGIQPPLASLGNMVGLGRDYIVTSWWIATIPGIAIFLLTFAVSVVGDWLRDYTDPSLR
ncbi:MAG TPA: ABC transporter permease [Devosiaceae bacterium]|jgi:peptide/nickel transport system permease protein